MCAQTNKTAFIKKTHPCLILPVVMSNVSITKFPSPITSKDYFAPHMIRVHQAGDGSLEELGTESARKSTALAQEVKNVHFL